MMNALKEVSSGSTEKIFNLALSNKNVKRGLTFAIMQSMWLEEDGFNYETRINHFYYNGISWCWICDKKTLPTCGVKQTI
jgi:hypothetical protein